LPLQRRSCIITLLMRTHRLALSTILTVLAALLAVAMPVAAQSPSAKELAAAFNLDTMRASAGRPWSRYQSRHFELYTEYPGTRATVMLDSLEEALSHATGLLGTTASDAIKLTVFVTGSRTRFPYVLTPKNKGVRTGLIDGREAIVLVVNDSVRSYARHEVMHSVGFRAWGPQRDHALWLPEGLATFADGLCQGIPISVVARDLLRQQPMLTVPDLTRRFPAMVDVHRHSAYVLAGSLIEFLWNARGREGVKRVWQGTDSLTQSGGAVWGLPDPAADVTRAWRAYVERVAGTRPGLSAGSLHRHGCG
jgi:hypothetical protein